MDYPCPPPPDGGGEVDPASGQRPQNKVANVACTSHAPRGREREGRSEMLSRLLRMTVMDNYVPNEGRKEGRKGGREVSEGGKKKKPCSPVCGDACNVFMCTDFEGRGGADG